MRVRWHLRMIIALFLLAPLWIAEAGTLHGTVKNGTTGKPAAGADVLLLQLQAGMETVANTKTDAQGRFTFDYPALGTQPMLVRAIYKGVNFHQPATPGRDTMELEVFEPSHDAKILSYPMRLVVFQPNGSSLLVGEEYAVHNASNPPQAYFRADGSFDFQIPDKAELQQVAASGPAGMPVVQATIERGTNRYAVAYAFRPGDSGVRVSYTIPYGDNRASIKLPMPYTTGRLALLAPPGVDVKGEGLQPGGSEQGMNIYVRDGVDFGKPFEISLSGTAPPPQTASAGGEAQGMPAGAGEDGGQDSGGSVPVQTIPGRMDVLKWPIIGGFAALFGLGAFFLMRRPVVAPAGAAAGHVQPASRNAAPSSGSAVDVAVGASLAAIKEAMFDLEVRRQKGAISEADYVRERARAEEILKSLVRG